MRKSLAVLAIITLSFWTTQTFAQDTERDSVTVPISYLHDLITVPLFVNNDGPYPFIIDTGSTTTVLYSGFSTKQDIILSGTTTTHVHGLNATQRRPLLNATQFRVGDFHLGTVFPVQAPPWTGERRPAGIIGTDLLKAHGIIVDSEAQQITFATPDTFEDLLSPSWRSVKLRPNPYDYKNPRGLFFVNMKINLDSRVPAILDTGAQFSMMNEATANQFFKNGKISNGRRTWVHKDVLAVEYVNKYVRIPKLRMGRTKWTKKAIVVKNMTSLDIINRDRRPLMIIGMDLMQGRDFAISFPDKRLYVSGPRDVKAVNISAFKLTLNDAPE